MTAAGGDRLVALRWGVRAALALGVSVSVVANVLHAADHPISQAISAWPPVALLVTVELVSRVPIHRRLLAAVRITATIVIALIAAYISYHHMAGVAARYGESDTAAQLLPLSVDGLVVVASICLIELTGRITGARPASINPSAPHSRTGRAAAADTVIPPIEPPAGPPRRDEPRQTLPAGQVTHAGAPTSRRTTHHQRGRPPGLSARNVATNPGDDPAATNLRAGPRPVPPDPRRTRPTADGPTQLRSTHDRPARVSTTTGTTLMNPAPGTAPVAVAAHAYEPVSADDALMYQAWRDAVDRGRKPTGVDLAQATGRQHDNSGHGRRAIRRYRAAHALPPPSAAAAET